MTTGTKTLYEQCEALFENYPLAVRSVTSDGTRSVLTLIEADVSPPRFYQLHLVRDAFCDLTLLSSSGSSRTREVIRADGVTDPGFTAAIVPGAVPLPRDGLMFGYAVGGKITALMPFYGAGHTEHPLPSWAIMPRVGEHRDLWPVFTGEPLFGGWFWQQYREGRIIDLAPVVAASPGAVHWVSTYEALGADCCVVTRDLQAGDATLPCGVYAYCGLLRDDVPVPPADVLLATCDVTDLAPRFEEMA